MKNILLWIKERIRLTFSDIFSFSAKASGGDFFTMIIISLFITWIVAWIVAWIVGAVLSFVFAPIFPKSWIGNINFALAIILFIYLQLANICRRLNDLGRDRWLAFLIFIPGLNILFELYLIFMPGKDK